MIAIDTELTYYISGPMSGIAEFNYPAFARAESVLTRTWGLKVKSPHSVYYGTPEEREKLTWHDYMKGAVRLMLECDGIVLLPGWPNSKGARAELDLALALEYPVYFYDQPFDIPSLSAMAGWKGTKPWPT